MFFLIRMRTKYISRGYLLEGSFCIKLYNFVGYLVSGLITKMLVFYQLSLIYLTALLLLIFYFLICLLSLFLPISLILCHKPSCFTLIMGRSRRISTVARTTAVDFLRLVFIMPNG